MGIGSADSREIEEKAKMFVVRAQELEETPGLYSTENIKFFVV